MVIDMHCVVYVHSLLWYVLQADAGANNDENGDENDNDEAGIYKGPQS